MIPRFEIKIPEIRNKIPGRIPEIRPWIRHCLGQDLGERFARSFRFDKFISASINHYYETKSSKASSRYRSAFCNNYIKFYIVCPEG